jgi:hypothetical protein
LNYEFQNFMNVIMKIAIVVRKKIVVIPILFISTNILSHIFLHVMYKHEKKLMCNWEIN